MDKEQTIRDLTATLNVLKDAERLIKTSTFQGSEAISVAKVIDFLRGFSANCQQQILSLKKSDEPVATEVIGEQK